MNPNSKVRKSRRFKERYAQHLFQNMDRFEGHLHLHGRNALGVIGRIKNDGYRYFEKESGQLKRWQDYCNELWGFLARDLPERKHEEQDLTTVLREYFQEFEHSSSRLDEMIHQVALDRNDESIVADLWDWLALAFRNSVYAIVACWTPDKKQTATVHMEINITTGKTTQEWTREEMVVPKKYKRRTKKP